jgi:hypothetical protein
VEEYATLTEEQRAELYRPVLRALRGLAGRVWRAPEVCATTVGEERLGIEVTDSLRAPWASPRYRPPPARESATPAATVSDTALREAVDEGWIDGVALRTAAFNDSASTPMRFQLSVPRPASGDTVVVGVGMGRSHACPKRREGARGFGAALEVWLVRRGEIWVIAEERMIAIS